MSGIAVPLIESLGPGLISLIAGIVHKEAPIQQANTGPGTGPVRFANVLDVVMSSLQAAANAGQIDKNLPSVDVIKVLVQTIVTTLKLPGGVLSDVPPAAAPAPVVVMPTGTGAAAALNLPPGTAIFTVVGGTLQLQQATK